MLAPAPPLTTRGPGPGEKVLKDTTLRSLLTGTKDIIVGFDSNLKYTKSTTGYPIFDLYDQALRNMAILCRFATADTSIVHDLIMAPDWATSVPNKAYCESLNNKITALDKSYSAQKKSPGAHNHVQVTTHGLEGTPAAGINQGIFTMKRRPTGLYQDKRPMASYCITPSVQQGLAPCRYVSTPNDVTFLVTRGDMVKAKTSSPLFLDTDLIISFKPSSTFENVKDDVRTLSALFTGATDLSSYVFPGYPQIPKTSGKVANGFMQPLSKAWPFLMKAVSDYKPTRLFLTGHSLGAAFATLTTFLISEMRSHETLKGIQSIHLVTFGSPTCIDDVARNRFNSFLDSGFVTLDRVVQKYDFIPLLPPALSHPGFQPLRMEKTPEINTGRAYNIDAVRKVYGGLFQNSAKSKYSSDTLTHMPNKLVVPTETLNGGRLPHMECMGMLVFGGLRKRGMKNPGFSGDGNFYTFVGDIFPDGVRFQYMFSGQQIVRPDAASDVSDVSAAISPSAPVQPSEDEPTDMPQPKAGRRLRTFRKKFRKYKSKTYRRK